MKVMLVNECPVGLAGSGGAEKHVQQLAEALSEQGHQAVLLTAQLPGLPETRAPGRYAIPHLTAPPLRKRFFQNMRHQAKALQTAADIVRAEAPDVIHIHNLMNPRALRLFRSLGPTVKSTHDCRPFCSKPYPVVASRLVGDSDVFCNLNFGPRCWTRCYFRAGKTPLARLEAWSYFFSNTGALREIMACDRLLVYSRYLHHLAVRQGVKESRINTLYLFTDSSGTDGSASYSRDNPPLILFAGRFSPEKGIRHLLEAASELPKELDFRLVLAGDGPLRNEIEQRAAELRPKHRVELPGFLPHAALLTLYRQAALVVFPSIGSEGCPLIGVEAMHCATPVVGFNVGGVGEWLLDRQTGLSVRRGDVAGLKAALEYMLRHPEERALMGSMAQTFVQAKFRRDTHIAGLMETYRQAAETRRAVSKGAS